MMVNWEFFDNQTPESAVDLVDDLRAGREVAPTRGARLCTFKQVSRVLAGFPDGRADEGPAAGPATLLGLEIYRQQQAEGDQGGTTRRTTAGAGSGTGYGTQGGPSGRPEGTTAQADPANETPVRDDEKGSRP
jgi:NADH-quinone oxidoreductase subunit E